MNSLRIATRNSPLALWQANYVKQQLVGAYPDLTVDIVSMTTEGDQLLDRSLATVGGKGLFLKELEVSLLKQETDIAVHSMKDVPVTLPDGLEIAVVCDREDARDAFVSNNYQNLYALPKGSRVGTSSLRRVAQLKSAFPDLEFIELRGNVNTRLAKLDKGDYDAVILAAAGLIRLKLSERIKQYIAPELCLPAVGQGIVGIECRSEDEKTKELIKVLHSPISALSIAAERAMNSKLDGGCQVPVAGFSEVEKGKIRMRGLVGEVDGSKCIFSDVTVKNMTLESATKLGENVAKDLLSQGAGEILSSYYDRPVELAKLEKPLVVLTRQEKYLGNMKTLLESLDYQPFHIPALKVEPKYDPEVLTLFANIDQFTDVLFVSRTAVEFAVPMIRQQSGLPDSIRVLAVGSETAKQLYKYGIDALYPHQGYGAKALLKVQQLQDMTDRKILVVRGDIGLDWPGEEMRKRGAEVVTAICYHNLEPALLANKVGELSLISPKQKIQGIFIHSPKSAINLLTRLMNYPDLIKDTKLIAGSDNIAETAKKCGWSNEIRVAKSPSNKHMMIAFSG